MVLSDRTIREELEKGRIVIQPLGEGCIQPASVDIHLDRQVLVFRNNRVPFVDVRTNAERLTEKVVIGDDDPFMLHPGEFVLGSTLEHVELPDDLVARLEGKSSLGRIGLLIHSTAGYVDPGWQGHLTPGAEQRLQPAHHPLPPDEDRPDLLPAADCPRGAALRLGGAGQQVPGPAGATPSRIFQEFQ